MSNIGQLINLMITLMIMPIILDMVMAMLNTMINMFKKWQYGTAHEQQQIPIIVTPEKKEQEMSPRQETQQIWTPPIWAVVENISRLIPLVAPLSILGAMTLI